RRQGAFVAARAGIIHLTRSMALELGPKGILVNALAVGALGQGGDRLVSHSPLKRTATAGEIGAALLFLAAPRNTYTTGHVMAVDGGWSIGYARDF
ncbi:MAG: SDR family oxidoreductase, partial [Rhizobiales bacterium]|nr:SDR family oxidoreductase [Hyphomicrobiales bacterium]